MDKDLMNKLGESVLDPLKEAKGLKTVVGGVIPEIPKTKGLGNGTSVTRSSGSYSIQKPNRKGSRTVRAEADPNLIHATQKNLVEESEQDVIERKLKKERALERERILESQEMMLQESLLEESENRIPRARVISGSHSLATRDSKNASSPSKKVSFDASTVAPELAFGLSQGSLSETSTAGSGSYQIVKSKKSSKPVRSEKVKLKDDVKAPRPASRLKQTFDKLIGRSNEAEVKEPKTTGLYEESSEIWFEDKPEGDKYWTVAADDSQRKDRSIWTLLAVFVFLTLLFGTLVWLLLSYSPEMLLG